MRNKLEAPGINVSGRVNAYDVAWCLSYSWYRMTPREPGGRALIFSYPGMGPSKVRIRIDEPGLMESHIGHEVMVYS